MFGLGQKVQRDPVGVVLGIGNHQDLGGAGDHVDAHLAEDAALGGGHVGVAGAGDLVDRGNGVGAIGQRRHGLRAADAIDLVHAGNPRRQKHQRVHLPLRGRYGDRQARHARDLGGDGIHQDRGRIGRLPARHIQPGGRDRRPAPAQGRTRGIGPAVIFGQLAFVVGADAIGGQFQRSAFFVRDQGALAVDLFGGDGQGFGRQCQPVQIAGQLDDRRIAPGAHIGDDPGHAVVHVGAVLALHVQKRGETGIEIGVGGGQEMGHGAAPAGEEVCRLLPTPAAPHKPGS